MMKKILYYLVPLATAFLLCGCLKDMKDGELLHGNREVLISIDLPGELASLDKSGFKVTMRNTKIGNTYTSETDAKGETRIDAEYGNYSVIISKVADVGGISKFLHATRDFVLNKDGQSAGTSNLEIKANYNYDQYFTLCNNSDDVQYSTGWESDSTRRSIRENRPCTINSGWEAPAPNSAIPFRSTLSVLFSRAKAGSTRYSRAKRS